MSEIQLMQAEVTALVKKLESVGEHGRKASRDAFRQAGGLLVSAIQGRAPVSDRPHYRYAPSGSRRAKKGSGKRLATYVPGNLKRSFKILTFRRSEAVFVGPKLAKGNAVGRFVGARTDAYYAGMVEAGTRRMSGRYFVSQAEAAAGQQTLRAAAELLRREIDNHITKIGLK